MLDSNLKTTSIFSQLNNVECNDVNDEHINGIYKEIDRHIDTVQTSKHEQLSLIYKGGYIADSLLRKLDCQPTYNHSQPGKNCKWKPQKIFLLYQ